MEFSVIMNYCVQLKIGMGNAYMCVQVYIKPLELFCLNIKTKNDIVYGVNFSPSEITLNKGQTFVTREYITWEIDGMRALTRGVSY